MNVHLLDTGLFLVTGFTGFDFGEPVRFFFYTGFFLLCVIVYECVTSFLRRRASSSERTILRKRYRHQIQSLRLSDTKYTEKLSFLIRSFLEEEGRLEKALKKTGKEIETSSIRTDVIKRLMSLTDTGSYHIRLTTEERQEIKRLALSLLS